MTAAAGQPRAILRRGAASGLAILRLLAGVVLTLALLLPLGIAAAAWRLWTGPVDVSVLARFVPELSVGRATVAWAGFRDAAAPVVLHVMDLRMARDGFAGTLAAAEVTLDPAALLAGRLAPLTAEMTGLRARVEERAGSSHASPATFDLSREPGRSLHHIGVHDASVALDGPVSVAALDAQFDREGEAIAGRATAKLGAGGTEATLSITAHERPDGTEIKASLTPVSPASLASLAAPLAMLDAPLAMLDAPLAMLDAPVTLTAHVSLGPDLAVRQAEADAAIGAGTIHAGKGTAPLLAATLHVSGTPDAVQASYEVRTAVSPTATPTVARGHASATRAAAGFALSAAIDVDQVTFEDLPSLWPEGTGGPGTRPWISRNITAGRLQDGHVTFDLTLPADLSDIVLTRIDGAIDGRDLTVHWLRPVPPMEHADGRLTITNPDVIDIAVTGARQAGGSLSYHDGQIRLTGISGKDQFANIRTGLRGRLADLLAVLNDPKIKLLSRRPIAMRDPAGSLDAELHVLNLPLKADVNLDELAIGATAHLTGVHLGGIAAGRDLDRGMLDLSASNDGLTVAGSAEIAGLPTRLKVAMDFRDGPPEQVQQAIDASAAVTPARLAALGFDAGGILGGAADIAASLRSRRDGRQDIAVEADLGGLSITEPQAGIDKKAGEPGRAEVHVRLQGDRLAAIDGARITAPGIDVRATTETAGGQVTAVHLDRAVLGTGTDVTGEIRLPASTGGLAVRLTGPSIDLSPLLRQRPGGTSSGMGSAPWRADLSFERVVLGEGRRLTGVIGSAESSGGRLRRLDLRGSGTAPFSASIVPERGGRRLTAQAGDLGGLLAAAGVTSGLLGGRLSLAARWDDQAAGSPLGGLATLADFRVRDAPVVGRILQALTIYGLPELLAGPGVGFTRLEAPFSWHDRVLTLRKARAFSASLGLTAAGDIDLVRQRLAVSGTVVPAYFFNSLLGRLPVVGRLFTAERGGGLFAAKVGVAGSLDDPKVAINPLSLITPGILRGLFGDSRP